jgi:hypothetical protein
MKRIARISTAAFLAGATSLAVSLPMPSGAKAGVTPQRIAELPIKVEEREKD